MSDTPSYARRRRPERRKRARIQRAVRSIRERLTLYRGLLLAAAVAVVILAGLLLANPFASGPDAVLIGDGKAGVKTVTDVTESSAPLAAEVAYQESETAVLPLPPADTDQSGRPAGSGEASYYGDELAGNPTASGERFDPGKFTAAHRTLPLGSRVRVTNLNTGASVIVRVNDRGPFAGHRVIDLSKAAAREIGMLRRGTARVRLELIPS